MGAEGITEKQLRAHVYRLAGDIGERNVFRPQGLEQAANYIHQQWRTQGYQVTRQSYTARGVESPNLEVTRRGSTWPDEIILLGAHYDSVAGSPGANDNASGIAALLELSRLFTTITPKTSVRFVAFTNEEPPLFMRKDMGSLVYAKAARRAGDRIRFMVSLETLGYYSDARASQRYPLPLRPFFPNRGDFIGFVSNLRSRAVMRRAARVFAACSDFPLQHLAAPIWMPGVAWSDQFSFWRQGYKAFMVTDTAPYRYPHYHSGRDTPEKLTYAPFTAVVNGLFHTFELLAELPSRQHSRR